LEFEGDILDGKRENHGKCYWPNGQLKFKGMHQANKIHDHNCKLYSENGILVYEGAIKAGKKTGLGKLYNEHDGSLRFKGGFKNGEIHQLRAKVYSGKKPEE
jgi:antitoxin component YwqK of YwqJK toxin-antitoxin module